MNPLNQLIHFRVNPSWTVCERVMYRTPFPNSEPNVIECWHSTQHGGPILDADDLDKLQWTTANQSVLDDGSLSIIDCGGSHQSILIKPVLFRDHDGCVHLGWPMVGYVDTTTVRRWKLEREFEVPPVNRDTEEYWAVREMAATRLNDAAAVSTARRMRWEILNKEFAPPAPPPPPQSSSGSTNVSGILLVHLSHDDILDMAENRHDTPVLSVENGEVHVSKIVGTDEIIAAAVERLDGTIHANFTDETRSANVKLDGDDGVIVEFCFDFEV